MANTSKPTLLIVHGGWHVPESYGKLTSALREAGFEVHIPRHLSMNQTRPPNADLESDSGLIRSYATSLIEAGRTVAVLMHSYGGQCGTNALYGLSKTARAAKGLPGGISHLIYMAAFALPEGKAMTDKVDEFGHMDRMPIAFGFDEDQSCVANYPREGLIGETYADQLDPEELKSYVATLLRWNGKCMYLPLQKTPAWRDEAKISYIYTLGDVTVPVDYQKSMVQYMEKEGKTVQTVELDTGHSPNLTATKGVVDAVLQFTSVIRYIDQAENGRCMENGEMGFTFTPDLVTDQRRCRLAYFQYNSASDVPRRKLVELFQKIVNDTSLLGSTRREQNGGRAATKRGETAAPPR
ncbi:alpha/beta-hydrolase [Xylariaceae sp. AK1471]|nr:alpha/beta-hydrolase [Xylariaceae sp. AK1471]